MKKLVLLRHAESSWNRENRFSGWSDVDLSANGLEQAREAGRTLKAAGFTFDTAHVSVLKRAIRTLWITLNEMDLMWIPVHHSWKLNERHYGALQGLNKAETAAQFGEDQNRIWRRSYDVPPPELAMDDERHPGFDPRYKDLTPTELPSSESLRQTVARVTQYWEQHIVPEMQLGRRIIIVAHGNSLRALVTRLEGIPKGEIVEFYVPAGMPLVYELDDNLQPIHRYYLSDPENTQAVMAEVANHGRRLGAPI